MPINPKDKRFCLLCKKEYMPIQNNQKYCKDCAPTKKNNETKYARFMRKIHLTSVRKSQRDWIHNHPEKRRIRENMNGNNMRKLWGSLGMGRDGRFNMGWRNAEIFAKKILEKEGFTEIVSLSYCHNFPFDVKCEKNGEVYLIEVTVCVAKNVRYSIKRRILQDLHLKGYIIYVKPDLSFYIIKDIMDKNSMRLLMKDLEPLKEENKRKPI